MHGRRRMPQNMKMEWVKLELFAALVADRDCAHGKIPANQPRTARAYRTIDAFDSEFAFERARARNLFYFST